MSVYEGRDIEPTRAGKTPGTKQRVGISNTPSPGGRSSGDRRAPGTANPGGLPEGRGHRAGSRQPGRKPRNTVPEAIADAVVVLAGEKYAGFNHSHLTEALAEREGIQLSRQTVSRLLNHVGLASARRHRPPKYRVRRERMPQEGMLLQIDGSHHRWLEERGPRFVLLLAVDDATGTVAGAIFQPEEDTRGYFLLMEGVIHSYGIPLALYGDRHGVFKFSGKPRHFSQPVGPTQFTRAMGELGVEQIFARSPQAKGRVERMAGPFQDRLVSELRLAGTKTLEEANTILQQFLPRFNHRFAVAAEQPEQAYRPVPADLALTETVSIKHTRKVARDNTVKYQWGVLQLLPGMDRPSYAGLRVDVLERADGELMIRYQGKAVDFQEAAPPSAALWGEGSGSFPSPEGSEVADGAANGHLNQAQRELLAGLVSSVRRKAKAKKATGQGRGTQGNLLRHQLNRTPTPTQQARWEAVQQARSQGLSQRAIAQKLGMARDTVGKYAKAKNPPTKLLSAKERAKAEALAASLVAAD